jgi:hypothetical protein
MLWQRYPWYPLHMSLVHPTATVKKREAWPCHEMKSGHPAISQSICWLSYTGSYCTLILQAILTSTFHTYEHLDWFTTNPKSHVLFITYVHIIQVIFQPKLCYILLEYVMDENVTSDGVKEKGDRMMMVEEVSLQAHSCQHRRTLWGIT